MLLVCLASTWAQSPAAGWLSISQSSDLAEIHRLLGQPNAPAWPELANVPSPLAQQIQRRIIAMEGLGIPEAAAVPDRVRMYADLAQRFRAAHGYANYVLADSLQILSILHLGRLLIADRSRASECATLLRALDLPLLTPQVFEEVYQAKLGPSFRLDVSTPEGMLAAMERLGDLRDGLPAVDLEVVSHMNNGALLARANPGALLLRFSNTDLLGRGALAELIAFLQKGGRLQDVNLADVGNYQKLIPPEYTPQMWGILRTTAGLSAVHKLMEEAGDPEADALLWALDGPRHGAASRFHLNEVSLGHVEGFETGFQMGISPDNRRFHFIVKRAGQEVLVTGQGESRAYDRIGEVLYNPQSTRLVFIASQGAQQRVVLDGTESDAFDRIDPGNLRFSPDGRHLAFSGIRTGRQSIVLDGREIGPFQEVLGLAFTSEQQLVYAYMTRRNGRWTIICGNHQSAEYERVSGARGVTFSPDGKTWTYQAMTNGQFFNFVEGAQTIAYAGNGTELRTKPVFSTNGRRIMFPNAARIGGAAIEAQFVNVGDPAIVRTIQAEKVFFSQDLRRLAAVKKEEAGVYSVTIDGREWRIAGVTSPVVHFDVSGDHFAIQSNANSATPVPNLIADGNPAPVEHRVEEFVFSPDGKHRAYSASVRSDQIRTVIVRDGQQIHSSSLGGNQSRLVFSPDNRHLAYTVAHGPTTWTLAVDGEEAFPAYDFIPFKSQLVFDSANTLHTIAVRNGEVLLVELTWDN